MTEAQRERAKFYASLASISNWKDLKEWERLKLEEELEHVMFPLIVDPTKDIRIFQQDIALMIRGADRPPSFVGKVPVGISEAEARRRLAKDLLSWLYTDATHLRRLLDGQQVSMHLSMVGIWTVRDGVFTEFLEERRPLEKILWDLYEIFKQKPFPFRHCPVCQTIFVPVRRQRYCTPICTYKGTEMARKEEKREYMRDYMADRRKRAKKRKMNLVNKKKED